jgi:hypothetical protein
MSQTDATTTSAVTSEFVAATLVTFGAMLLYDELDAAQRERIVVPFADPNRTHWNFLPESGRRAHGLALKELTHTQQLLAHRMIASSLSIDGYAKVLMAMSLEHLLRELDQPRLGYVATEFRDPGNYVLTFFDQPQPDATWGWRLVGHHISLNVTIVDQDTLVATPLLFGAEPGRVGPVRPLAAEEDLAFALLEALTEDQRRRAIIHPVSPADFVTRCVPVIGDVERPNLHGDGRRDVIITEADREALRYERDRPRGIAVGELSGPARACFDALLSAYVGRVADRLQAQEMERIEAAGIERIHFAWAGGTDTEHGHYYRLQGPVTLIEFNNTEGNANHIHSVWRDPSRDFALDLLA